MNKRITSTISTLVMLSLRQIISIQYKNSRTVIEKPDDSKITINNENVFQVIKLSVDSIKKHDRMLVEKDNYLVAGYIQEISKD